MCNFSTASEKESRMDKRSNNSGLESGMKRLGCNILVNINNDVLNVRSKVKISDEIS
jgi:hypothetical protein